MIAKSSDSMGETILAVALAAAVAWAVSTTSNRPSGKQRASRRPARPTNHSVAMARHGLTQAESDWEEFDRETAELEAERRRRRSEWSTAQTVFTNGV